MAQSSKVVPYSDSVLLIPSRKSLSPVVGSMKVYPEAAPAQNGSTHSSGGGSSSTGDTTVTMATTATETGCEEMEDAISGVECPDFAKMKRKRHKRTVTAGVTGGIIGFAVGGPIGAMVVGAASAHVVKKASKEKERKTMSKYHEKLLAAAAGSGVLLAVTGVAVAVSAVR